MARTSGTTKQRGYSGEHPKLRRHWKPIVDAGQAHCHAIVCLQPSRWIQPGTPWHLGHTADRTAWTGPEHERCNTADGARRKNHKQRTRITTGQRVSTPAAMQPSRNW